MSDFWSGRKVLVTGGAGFVGSHLVEELRRRAPDVRLTIADLSERPAAGTERVLKLDLRSPQDCLEACRGQEIVLNLAARVAGVGYNRLHHGTMFRDNMQIAANMIEAARVCGVERFLVVSSACVYARDCPIPMRESDGFRDRPEPTNEGYGWAKRMAEFLARAYHDEFGMRFAVVRPANTYGPRDHFDSADCHVIAALMRRVAAGENPVRVWGDGSQTRSFIYVEDFARGLLDAIERHDSCEPVNLASEEEVSIRELAALIRDTVGSRSELVFDPAQPAGQPRRRLDARRAREAFGFQARVGLAEGLRRTWAWYRERSAS
ncbi:MAG: NAD-dependent epimerase/dehydratase family protein [Elusimicrobia bacterium]|nr:NAD-dependent epimerase/dehydratase family protein [Elusimicrobiota bacterium]